MSRHAHTEAAGQRSVAVQVFNEVKEGDEKVDIEKGTGIVGCPDLNLKFGSIGLEIKQVGGKKGTVGVDAKKPRGFTGSDNFKPMLVSGIRIRDGKSKPPFQRQSTLTLTLTLTQATFPTSVNAHNSRSAVIFRL